MFNLEDPALFMNSCGNLGMNAGVCLSCFLRSSNLWLCWWFDLIPLASGSAPCTVCKQRRLARDRFNLALWGFSLFSVWLYSKTSPPPPPSPPHPSQFQPSSYCFPLADSSSPLCRHSITLPYIDHPPPSVAFLCLSNHSLPWFTLVQLCCCILLFITFSLVWLPSWVSDLAFIEGEEPP